MLNFPVKGREACHIENFKGLSQISRKLFSNTQTNIHIGITLHILGTVHYFTYINPFKSHTNHMSKYFISLISQINWVGEKKVIRLRSPSYQERRLSLRPQCSFKGVIRPSFVPKAAPVGFNDPTSHTSPLPWITAQDNVIC